MAKGAERLGISGLFQPEKPIHQMQHQGRQASRRLVLLKQLQLKFRAEMSPEVASRVEAASTEQLELWLERLLFAEHIVDVFAPAGDGAAN